MSSSKSKNRIRSLPKDNQCFRTFDKIQMAVMFVLSYFIMGFEYDRRISIIIQMVIVAVVFFLNKKRPVFFLVAYMLFTIAPTKANYTYSGVDEQFYSINSKTSLVILPLLLLVLSIIDKKPLISKIPSLLFPVWMLFTYLWTPDTQYFTIEIFLICVIYLIAPNYIQDDYDIKIALFSYVLSAALYCLKIIPMVLDVGSVYLLYGAINRNHASLFIIMTILCGFIFIMNYSKNHIGYAIFTWGVIAVSTIMLYTFASRTSVIMLILIVIYYIFSSFDRKKIKYFLLILIAISAGLFIAYRFNMFEFLISRFHEDSIHNAGGRFEITRGMFGEFFASSLPRALVGHGFQNVRYNGLIAHNSFMGILLSFGIIGFLLYLAYIIYPIIKLFNTKYRHFIFMIIIIILYSFSLEPYHISECVIAMSLIYGSIGVTENERKKS